MAMTPASDPSSYVTPSEFLLRKDVRPAQRLVKDDGTSASSLASDPVLIAVLQQASGMVESAAFLGARYAAVDLRALVSTVNNGGEYLKGIISDIAAHILTERRWVSSAETLEGYKNAMILLDKMSQGLAVLPFAEVAAASVAVNRDMQQDDLDQLNLISRNVRFFGLRRSFYPRPGVD